MNNKNTPYENLAQSALASGSLPGILLPQKLNGYVLIDGGSVWNVNLNTAVEQCLEKVDDPKDVIVDVAVCGYHAQPTSEATSNKAYENYQNSKNIRDYYSGGDSVWAQSKAYPGIQMRYYFQEVNDCPGAGSIDMNNSTTWCMQEAGRADAKAMLDIGSDKVSSTFDEWNEDFELRKTYPYFRDYLNKVYSYIFN